MRRGFVAGAALALTLLTAPAGAAQVEDATDETPAPTAVQAEVEAPPVLSSGLPRRAPLPRTMEAYWPIFAIFVASWLGIVGYTLMTGRRTANLTRQLSAWEERR